VDGLSGGREINFPTSCCFRSKASRLSIRFPELL
jgi:hypothetical protein